MPILFVEMMQPRLKGIQSRSAGHPPTPLRVRLVSEYLRSFGVGTTDFERVFEAYEYDYDRKLREMPEDKRGHMNASRDQADKLLSPLADVIASRVNSLGLRRFEESNASGARALRDTLVSRQPISGRRVRRDEEIFERLTSLKSGESTAEQAYAALSELEDKPVLGSEIVTAGWLHRLSSFES